MNVRKMLLQFVMKFICCELNKLKTNLTMFLIFFWIIWFSQIIAISTVFMRWDIRRMAEFKNTQTGSQLKLISQ